VTVCGIMIGNVVKELDGEFSRRDDEIVVSCRLTANS